MFSTSGFLKNSFFLAFVFCTSANVNAGLNKFTDLIFVDEWLIERRLDLNINVAKCRASIPSHANWFGARVRLGPNDELIKPIWISINDDQLLDSKLAKVKKRLYECRLGFIFLPDNL